MVSLLQKFAKFGVKLDLRVQQKERHSSDVSKVWWNLLTCGSYCALSSDILNIKNHHFVVRIGIVCGWRFYYWIVNFFYGTLMYSSGYWVCLFFFILLSVLFFFQVFNVVQWHRAPKLMWPLFISVFTDSGNPSLFSIWNLKFVASL